MPDYHTFLSHSSADKPAVEELARRLKRDNIEPWLDKWNLIPGNPWQEDIEQALEACATCCVFIGPHGIGPWQNAEMRAAIDQRISTGGFRVIPVLLPGGNRGKRSKLPTFLTQTTWVTLGIEHLGKIHAQVVWQKDNLVGLQFAADPRYVSRMLRGVLPDIRAAA